MNKPIFFKVTVTPCDKQGKAIDSKIQILVSADMIAFLRFKEKNTYYVFFKNDSFEVWGLNFKDANISIEADDLKIIGS